ncbi:MAG: hypothetical protein HOP12_13040, partial [Candidatus Eisenbacteria bacterium]|nr:hypothetical protein [Candidatus Eisenbacteria bacterium]
SNGAGSGDSWLARLAAWWLAPARRPVLATAGLLVVATVGLAWLRVTPMPERQVSALRGDSQESGVQVLEPQRWNGGRRVNLRWEAVAGADAYRVRFLSDELEEIGFAGPLRETHYDLTAAPPAVTGRSTVIYQIEALQGLDVIATSATRSYTRP